jgi:hypothetical protein
MSAYNEFPFAPFFQLLSANGIKVTLADYDRVTKALCADGEWTRGKLRAVLQALIVKTPEQEKTFRECFNSFFSDELPEYSKEAVSKFRRNLEEGVIDEPPKKPDGQAYWRLVDYIVALLGGVLILGAIAFFIELRHSNSPLPGNKNNASVNNNINVQTTNGSEQPSATLETWQVALIVLGLLGGTLYGVSRVLGAGVEAPISIALSPAPEERPHVFMLSQVGSDEFRLLTERTLERLSSSLRHVMSEQLSKRLDLISSISASARQAGLMSLIYQHVRIIKRVYLIVDISAESLSWNSTARELASGLSQRGVQVIHGEFYGSPEKFRTKSGGLVWLEDLEEDRNNSMLFIFSDGKQLDYRRDRVSLESLARWPSVAWLDLREPKFWDESAQLIGQLRIPLFPANEGGLLAAMEHFLTERNGVKAGTLTGPRWRGAPAFTSGDLGDYLESLLGDALPWAQACAMMQPLPLKLANTLRSRFTPELPPERIERLFRLPGTWWDASGLQFSNAVLSILRHGFAIRWDECEQSEILHTIIDEIKSVEPPEKDSIRHLAWEYALERVRLELEPDAALPRLVQLLETPLATHVRAELSQVLTSGDYLERQGGDGGIPLRKAPKTPMALKQLKILTSPAPIKFGERLMRSAESWWRWIKSYRLVQLLIIIASATLEFLVYFPYQRHERDAAGYSIK